MRFVDQLLHGFAVWLPKGHPLRQLQSSFGRSSGARDGTDPQLNVPLQPGQPGGLAGMFPTVDPLAGTRDLDNLIDAAPTFAVEDVLDTAEESHASMDHGNNVPGGRSGGGHGAAVTSHVDGHGGRVGVSGALDPTHTHGLNAASSHGAVSVAYDVRGGGSSSQLDVKLLSDRLELSRSLSWAQPEGGSHKLTAGIGFSQKWIAIGGSGSWTDADGMSRTAGLRLQLVGSRGVKDLGAYDGEEPALAGTRFVQLSHQSGGGLVPTVGLLTEALGIGGRLAVDAKRAITYRTHLPPDTAQALLFDERSEGLVGYFRNKALGMGLAQEAVHLPDLSAPESLKVGDELVVSTSGGVVAGVVVGGPALGGVARVGTSALVRGEFEIGVRRVAEDLFELVLTPTRLTSVHLYLDAGVVVELSHDRVGAASFTQAFAFDLSQPEAKAAYLRSLQGEMPNGLGLPTGEEADEAHELLALVRGEQLPEGVSRLYLERVEAQQQTSGGGLDWGILDAWTGFAGLSAHHTAGQEKRVVTDGRVALSADTRGTEGTLELLWSGHESAGVFASVVHRTTVDDAGAIRTELGALRLVATFEDDRQRALEVNRDVIDRLNAAFGTAIPHEDDPSRGEQRRVRVERAFAPEDFGALATALSDEATLRQVAHRSGVSPKALRKLSQELAKAPTPDAMADRLQRFVSRHGLSGFGALHQALGDPSALTLSSKATLYTEPIEEACTLAFKYPQAIDLDTGPEAIVRRFREVAAVASDLEVALDHVKDDPLLDEKARAKLTARLLEAREQTERLSSLEALDDDERATLRALLEEGGLSRAEGELLLHLSA